MKRTMLAGAVVTACVIAAPVAAAQGSTIKSQSARGVVYGGVTGIVAGSLQGYPVVFELNKAGTKILNADIVVDLACSVPPNATGLGDSYKNIPIKHGAFKTKFGPARIPADPAAGTGAVDVSGSMAGRVNQARTKINGTWSLKMVLHDPADPTGAAVLDTCDSGTVNYTAKN
jgi:hypothetical protein